MNAKMEFTSETTARCIGCDLTWEGSGGGGRYVRPTARVLYAVARLFRKPRPFNVNPEESPIHWGEFTFGSMEELAFVPATDDELEWGNYGNAFRCDNCKHVYPTEQWTWDAVQGADGVVVVDAIAISD